MDVPINMPQVGQDIEKARIVDWYVAEGQEISEGDTIATVESDKASFEVVAHTDGIIKKILYSIGEEAKVFTPIAYLENSKNNSEENAGGSMKVLASPSAKRIASENGIDISTVKGSGPKGRITREDVQKMIDSVHGGPVKVNNRSDDDPFSQNRLSSESLNSIAGRTPEDKVIFFKKGRKQIADRLLLSKQTIPHFYLFTDVDFSRVTGWLQDYKDREGKRLTINDLLVNAVAQTLVNFPELNSHVFDQGIIIKKDINIGIAVATENGVMVPVIPFTDRLRLDEISEVSIKIIEEARNGKVRYTHTATFTVTNLGMYGVNSFLPIINPPECAILSAGRMVKKLVPGPNGFREGDFISIGLACDHRAVDGSIAAGFLDKLKTKLEDI